MAQRDAIRDRIEAHEEATIVGQDDTGQLTIEVPQTIPADLDRAFRDAGVEVVRKTPVRFEVRL